MSDSLQVLSGFLRFSLATSSRTLRNFWSSVLSLKIHFLFINRTYALFPTYFSSLFLQTDLSWRRLLRHVQRKFPCKIRRLLLLNFFKNIFPLFMITVRSSRATSLMIQVRKISLELTSFLNIHVTVTYCWELFSTFYQIMSGHKRPFQIDFFKYRVAQILGVYFYSIKLQKYNSFRRSVLRSQTFLCLYLLSNFKKWTALQHFLNKHPIWQRTSTHIDAHYFAVMTIIMVQRRILLTYTLRSRIFL